MKTQPLALPLRSTHARHPRAHFSPLLRRATQDAFIRHDVATRLTRTFSAGRSLEVEGSRPTSEGARHRWWDPYFLDRLSSPLTRFRD